ncbi:uncharacterized protein [Dermacentor andersoni]|uniref:uncharacterized protein n=1 Tax=Dermacentor andersoni TaxID=34620 RepID=UPI003B3AD581
MELAKPPEHLQLSGSSDNIAKNWNVFIQKFELFLQATASTKEPRSEAVKAALLLSVAGDDALEVFNSFTFLEAERKDDYTTVVRKLKEYCEEQENEVYERYFFRSRTQDVAEPFEDFLRDLRKLSRSCNFAELTEPMIHDQVVFGVHNLKLREKLIKVKDLTLAKTEQICEAAELSSQQNEAWTQAEKQVASIKKRPFKCMKCNRSHERSRCPAFGKTCFVCRGANHFAACCKEGSTVGEVVNVQDTFDILDVKTCSVRNSKDWIVNAKVAGQDAFLKVNTLPS